MLLDSFLYVWPGVPAWLYSVQGNSLWAILEGKRQPWMLSAAKHSEEKEAERSVWTTDNTWWLRGGWHMSCLHLKKWGTVLYIRGKILFPKKCMDNTTVKGSEPKVKWILKSEINNFSGSCTGSANKGCWLRVSIEKKKPPNHNDRDFFLKLWLAALPQYEKHYRSLK